MKMLKSAGYDLIRTTGGHRIFQRAKTTITLGSTGNLSPWLTQLVFRAADQAIAEEAKEGGKGEPLPLTVEYQGRTWAVINRGLVNYRLMDLDKGSELSAPISQCNPVQVTLPKWSPLPTLEATPELTKEVKPVVEEERVARIATPFSNESDRDAWVRLTQRYIDGLNTQVESLTNQLVQVEARRDALQTMLNTITGRTAIPLPSRVGRPNLRIPVSDADKDKIRMYTLDGKRVAEISQLLGRIPNVIYRTQDKLRKEGKLPAKS